MNNARDPKKNIKRTKLSIFSNIQTHTELVWKEIKN